MSYEEAFEALKNGDFRSASPLLARAAEETGYSSDVVNHAFTLALYHCGEKTRLADVAFRVANSLIGHDPASAMDYFQRALCAGLDAQRIRHIGGIFEQWASPKTASQSVHQIAHVAHVVGSLSAGDVSTEYVRMLVSSLKEQEIRSTVFTTEWAASWFFNPDGVPNSRTIPIDADVKIASVEGDFLERAERVVQNIRDSGIQVAFFHASLEQQITARVAALRAAPVQISVNHGDEIAADLFDGRIHLFYNALERGAFSGTAEWIPPASDIEERLRMAESVTRQSMGLESATTISATFGDLQNAAGRGYLRTISEIMQRFPKHFHIFAGNGNVKAIRSHLHSEGVLPRVRFLGDVTDVAPLLGIIDIYLASFPGGSARAILEAMGAGRPAVVVKFPPDSSCNSGAELVGVRELIAPGEADYIEIADRLLRTPSFRAEQGKAVLERFRAEFRPERLGIRYRSFLERF